MKVISVSSAAQTTTYLPPEIIEVVSFYLKQNRSRIVAQKDLWSCCLVSQKWYATTIKHLYEAPHLTSRNFAEFARTMCPAIRDHVRQVGLESFVQYLDMGRLAYESKKSVTTRLLSRTKVSLKSFVAPAVSFSVTSLAPLSKCLRLEHLDLSRDSYSFSLSQLMHAIESLTCLTSLSLPRDCLTQHRDTNYRSMEKQGKSFWPQNLSVLEINDQHLEPSAWEWKYFLSSLPASTRILIFANCSEYDTFDNIVSAEELAPQITTLSITVHRSDDMYYLNHIVQPFPNVVKLTIPAITSWEFKNFFILSYTAHAPDTANRHWAISPPSRLETLILEQSPDFVSSSHIKPHDLSRFVEECPALLHIEVPEDYLDLDDDDNLLDELDDVLSRRAAKRKSDNLTNISTDRVGIFTTPGQAVSAVGMKRSFRYRGEG